MQAIKSIAAAAVAFSVLFTFSGPAPAQSASGSPQLVGIAKFPQHSYALLEVPIPQTGNASAETMILSEGERQKYVEVVSINITQRSVGLVYHGSNVVVSLGSAVPPSNSATANEIDLTNASFRATLQLFAKVSNRTLLLRPGLPEPNFAIRASVVDSESTIQVFVTALADQGIAAINDGEKFVMIVPKSAAATAQPRSDQILIPPGDAGASTNLIPAGMMVMNGTDCWQMAPTYAALMDRKLDLASRTLPMQPFFFRNQTALTRPEFIYAFEVMFAWRGYKLVPVDDKLAKLTRIETK